MLTPRIFRPWPFSEKPLLALNVAVRNPSGARYVSTTAPPTFTSTFTWYRLGALTDQSCGDVTVSIWLTDDVAFAATLAAALSPVVTAAPVGPSTVDVTVTEAALVDWFCTSVATEIVAEPAETEGVVTYTPPHGTWTGFTFTSQTFR